jgi:hypothetical protein
MWSTSCEILHGKYSMWSTQWEELDVKYSMWSTQREVLNMKYSMGTTPCEVLNGKYSMEKPWCVVLHVKYSKGSTQCKVLHVQYWNEVLNGEYTMGSTRCKVLTFPLVIWNTLNISADDFTFLILLSLKGVQLCLYNRPDFAVISWPLVSIARGFHGRFSGVNITNFLRVAAINNILTECFVKISSNTIENENTTKM